MNRMLRYEMNQKLKYYMKQHYPAIISGNLGEGFHASLIDIPSCSATGKIPQELMLNLRRAKKEWFRAAIESGVEIPEPYKRKLNV